MTRAITAKVTTQGMTVLVAREAFQDWGESSDSGVQCLESSGDAWRGASMGEHALGGERLGEEKKKKNKERKKIEKDGVIH